MTKMYKLAQNFGESIMCVLLVCSERPAGRAHICVSINLGGMKPVILWNCYTSLSQLYIPKLKSFSWTIFFSFFVKHTGCNRRKGPDFGGEFLRSNYTDITQNTYIQSWTVTEILAREKSGLLWCLRTVLFSMTSFSPLLELHSYVRADVAPAA